MKKFISLYAIGDMVIHRSYGAGLINGIEHKPIDGTEVECFKVKTKNGTYWFPTGNKANPQIHPLASQDLIQRVIEVLRSAPGDLENDHNQWNERIDHVQQNGDILAISNLIRDLAVLKMTSKLNRTQAQALKNLEGRLLREWAASLAVDIKLIKPKLQACLQESKTIFQTAM